MAGGPSHLETFDPKPLLNKLHGQKRPAEFGEAKYQFVTNEAKILGTKRTFKKYGKAGIDVSDLLPHTAQIVDDIAVIRSCHGDMVVHSAAQYQLMTGRILPGFPSMGSWVLYGLGAETDSLPAYVVIPDPKGALEAGQPMYTNGFLPAVYQPTMLRSGAKPVLNLDLPKDISLDQRKRDRSAHQGTERSQSHAGRHRVRSSRQRLRSGVSRCRPKRPAAFDLSKETEATREMYGIGKEPTDDYGRRCLLARRMVEKGRAVRVRRLGWRTGQHAVGRARGHRRESSAHGRLG